MTIDAVKLLDKGWAKTLAAKIDPAKRVALPKAPTPGNETTYISIVDKDRMAVSFINTLYSNFGHGLCTEKTGIMFTNRGACFTLEPGHPNVIGPSKRPMHTIIPALAMRNGRVEYSFGVMGAHYQPMGHVQIVLNLIDYGMDVQQAIEAPRAFFVGEDTAAERGVPAATIEGLKQRGHHVTTPEVPWGGAQVDQHRLGPRRADRGLRVAQGRLRARLLMRQQRLGRAIGGDRFARFRASALPRLCDLIPGGDELSQKWRLPEAGGRLSSNLRASGDESAGRVDRLRALIGLAQSVADQPLSRLSGRGDFHQASVQ